MADFRPTHLILHTVDDVTTTTPVHLQRAATPGAYNLVTAEEWDTIKIAALAIGTDGILRRDGAELPGTVEIRLTGPDAGGSEPDADRYEAMIATMGCAMYMIAPPTDASTLLAAGGEIHINPATLGGIFVTMLTIISASHGNSREELLEMVGQSYDLLAASTGFAEDVEAVMRDAAARAAQYVVSELEGGGLESILSKSTTTTDPS